MTKTTKFIEVIKGCYSSRALYLLRFLGIILVGLNLVLVGIAFKDGLRDYLELAYASWVLFVAVALIFPAFKLLMFVPRFLIGTGKQVFSTANEVKKMTSFQRYLLILVALVLVSILVAIIIQ